ncbi:MAG: tetraacyldisaccharide 4'-kinase [Bacteroidota bacterium]
MPGKLPPVLRVLLLYPLSVLYGIGVSLRNRLFDFKILKSRTFSISIICVGNITVGGTGKTPHVEYIIDFLKDEFSIATLSRGYKRKTRDFRIVTAKSKTEEVGDEPLQIKKKYNDITVAVDRNRVHGIEQLIEKVKDLNLVLLDDGFQHRYVKPGLSILLVDYNRMITHDHLLPYGRLREKKSAKRRANIIIVTKCPGGMKPIEQRLLHKELSPFPYQNLFYTTLRYDDPAPVFGAGNKKISARNLLKEKKPAIALCGIANPEPFINHIKSLSNPVIQKILPDHYSYTNKDIQGLKRLLETTDPEALIFTTEKDAMHLRELENMPTAIKKRMYYIPVKIDFLNQDTEKFKKILYKYVRQNKRSGFIHPS